MSLFLKCSCLQGIQQFMICCLYFLQESKQVCHYEMQGPGIPPLHISGSLSMPTSTGSSSSQAPEAPAQVSLHLHPHLTSGRNLEIIWSKSHLVMRMIEMRIGQEPLLQVRPSSLVPRCSPPTHSPRLGANVVTSPNEFPGERVLAVCHSVTSRNFAPSRVS